MLQQLKEALQDKDSAVRYWGALGIRMRGKDAVAGAREELYKALADAAPSVRIAAAEALGKFGDDEDGKRALAVLLELAPLDKNGPYLSMMALNALDEMGARAKPGLAVIKAATKGEEKLDPRIRGNVTKLVEKMVADLDK